MKIIASLETPAAEATRPGRVILVERECTYEPFVTAWQGGTPGDWDSSWCWGHYFADLDAAKADYLDRCKRGY